MIKKQMETIAVFQKILLQYVIWWTTIHIFIINIDTYMYMISGIIYGLQLFCCVCTGEYYTVCTIFWVNKNMVQTIYYLPVHTQQNSQKPYIILILIYCRYMIGNVFLHGFCYKIEQFCKILQANPLSLHYNRNINYVSCCSQIIGCQSLVPK